MYALVEIKGKQFKAQKGALLKVDKIDQIQGETVDFDQVLLLHDDDSVKIGTPYVKNAAVKVTVEDHGKDRKVVVKKFKKRKGYQRTQGHRQQYTLVRVDDIVSG